VAKVNLSNMSVESLMELRKRVDKALLERRAEMEKQLARMDTSISGEREARRGGGTSALRGRKVPPKYRNRSGETWAGRGAKPRWLVAAIKEGKKLEDFLIEKTARKRRAKK
jgi:DNA-binding protein H-NS